MTPGKLAKWMGLSTGGVTVMLDRLEQGGYIRREANHGIGVASWSIPIRAKRTRFSRTIRRSIARWRFF